jgi:molybdopterin-guanine dinucleotide biosynthesis protein A
MISDCTALILAGGESRRMGRDKAELPFGETTLLQQLLAILQPLFTEVIVSVRQPRSEIAVPQVQDDLAHAGPLAGLAAGLARSRTPWLFVVACDMPFITSTLIEHLNGYRSEFIQAVVPMVGGHPQPLAAFYAASCLPSVRGCLAGNGKHSLRELLEQMQVRYVEEHELRATDPSLRSFIDLDTPQDVAVALKMGSQ